jgi:hypothetical protein
MPEIVELWISVANGEGDVEVIYPHWIADGTEVAFSASL